MVTQDAKTSKADIKKPGTQIEAKITVFPDKNDGTIIYYQNLHMFSKNKGWFSIGFKPKAKDLKTFIEDLNQFEYL